MTPCKFWITRERPLDSARAEPGLSPMGSRWLCGRWDPLCVGAATVGGSVATVLVLALWWGALSLQVPYCQCW